jgi:hypothetical protein
MAEEVVQEIPLNRIKGLPEVNFQKATGRRTFPTILPEKFLNKINVITHEPPTQESILIGADDIH